MNNIDYLRPRPKLSRGRRAPKWTEDRHSLSAQKQQQELAVGTMDTRPSFTCTERWKTLETNNADGQVLQKPVTGGDELGQEITVTVANH